MYRDIIFYCPNVPALGAELSVKLPDYVMQDDDGNYVFLVPKTPTVRMFNESLALVRLTDDQLALLAAANIKNLTAMGTYAEVFADPAKRVIYDRVYPRAPVIASDGSVRIPPEQFGVIA